MTPIQTHEAELRAMMERAGLASAVRGTIVGGQGPGKDWSTPIAMVTEHHPNEGMFVALYGQTDDSPRHTMAASHPDPRIALRHCLEMAGLLTDRPPQTDEQLVAWLTERWGEPRREGSELMESTVDRWSFHGVEYRHHAPRHLRWSDGRSLMGADAFGALMWCAERFPEVNP
jgi:hypothetical protein